MTKVVRDYFVAPLLVMTVFVSHSEPASGGQSNLKASYYNKDFYAKSSFGTACTLLTVMGKCRQDACVTDMYR